MATILPKPGEAIDSVEPTRYLNERMAYYMVSRYRQLSGQRAGPFKSRKRSLRRC